MKSALIVLSLLAVLPCWAGEVDLRTGNFSVDFEDIRYPGEGIPVAIRRVYNSRSDFTGMFGTGWSSNIETYLTVYPDGTAVVHEWGGGAQTRFQTEAVSQKLIENSVEKLAEIAQKRMHVSGAEEIAAYRKHLTTDPAFRRAEWENASRTHDVEAPSFPSGTRWASHDFGAEEIVRAENGFKRARSDRMVEIFDSSGRLVRTEDPNQNYVAYTYDSSGHLNEIRDNFRRTFSLTWKDDRVASIASLGNESVSYSYTDKNLAEAKPSRGFHSKYRYDANHRFLLTWVSSPAGDEEISYYGVDKNEAPKSHVDVLRRKESFEFSWTGPSRIASASKKIVDSNGKPVISEKVDYHYTVNSSGEQFLASKTEVIDGEKNTIEYDLNSGEPAKIVSKEGTYERKYSGKGALIERKTPAGRIEFARNAAGNLLRLTQFDNQNKVMRSIQYQYDSAGNLTGVHFGNSFWKFVRDQSGRIKILAAPDRRRYDLSYDEHSVLQGIASGSSGLRVVYQGVDRPVGVRGVTGEGMKLIEPLIHSVRSAQESAPEANFGTLIEQLESISHLKALSG